MYFEGSDAERAWQMLLFYYRFRHGVDVWYTIQYSSRILFYMWYSYICDTEGFFLQLLFLFFSTNIEIC